MTLIKSLRNFAEEIVKVHILEVLENLETNNLLHSRCPFFQARQVSFTIHNQFVTETLNRNGSCRTRSTTNRTKGVKLVKIGEKIVGFVSTSLISRAGKSRRIITEPRDVLCAFERL